ncbi:3-hydroxyacyl-CoA dehydrogenase NAD-binding domain-containing protein [Sphingobium sp.]|uniref:3-hydroxyacyl-CoA dehydrogenase NAD-binding domain-containing protein n=1 Tax=Sphingobium sp. TaxID=1912891 RepID=UPI0028BE96BC|nr:3-hydroxyacyl-CoA dehydrogenase NAD-binding domain-containing protein [Sphingobium sp.]
MIRFEVDAEGFATISWDLADRPVNILTPESRLAFVEAIDRALESKDVKGIVITSAKDDFIVGADLAFLQSFRGAPSEYVAEKISFFRDALRRLERSSKPVVAAVTGTALGGGLEVCLACNHRIIADRPKANLGLPEVTLGLMPGAGGTQRLPRIIGIEKALPLLLEGKTVSPQEALALGFIDQVVPADQLLDSARAWLRANCEAEQPWNSPRFKMPGAAPTSREVHALFMASGSRAQARSRDLIPAPQAILSAVFEGCRIPIDQALAVELSYFVSLLRGDVAQNIIRTSFFSVNEARKLAARPMGVAKFEPGKLGIIGAGLMGNGVAEVAALAGLDIVLIDRDAVAAAKSLERITSSIEAQVRKGRLSSTRAKEALARITPSDSLPALTGCDAVVEAVFEDRAVKTEVIRGAIAAAGPHVLFASNTSKIPISGLAENSSRPDRFIGLHFFSPVPRMPLLEIIRGQETSDETLAQALDLCKLLGKTPIVVRDGPGFYTSRCVSSYLNEGIALLAEGVSPAIIENSGQAAGMPLGPLSLADEVGLDLMHQIRVQERADNVVRRSGAEFEILGRLVTELGRRGRKGGGGFFEYPEGAEKQLWSGLAEFYAPRAVQPMGRAIQERLMYVQALEAARCFDEDVIESARDADIGSILGWGFPRHTGGVISFIDTIGIEAFIEQADALAQRYGERYEVPSHLRMMASSGKTFHAQVLADNDDGSGESGVQAP